MGHEIGASEIATTFTLPRRRHFSWPPILKRGVRSRPMWRCLTLRHQELCQELVRRERDGRDALPGCFAGASALEHAARALVAQRGELSESKPTARADGDQPHGSVVQKLPDLATAAATALPDAVAAPKAHGVRALWACFLESRSQQSSD
jgi:hypothetical protein